MGHDMLWTSLVFLQLQEKIQKDTSMKEKHLHSLIGQIAAQQCEILWMKTQERKKNPQGSILFLNEHSKV